ncbi:MAG: NTP transferase domain-containing protein [Methanobrevibacter sp.]|jgi:molybdenum cofactor cytidylyltransferase|nr:NTP transferase domain-containing protein [Candidatus Methanoflexus mossambicus]
MELKKDMGLKNPNKKNKIDNKSSISAIITAAGRSSRMIKDLKNKGLTIENKLLLPLNNETVIEKTINNVLNSNISEIILVLGHYGEKIKKHLDKLNYTKPIKIIKNKEINVGLSSSLLNGINNTKNETILCLPGDQPTVSTKTYNNLINEFFKENNSYSKDSNKNNGKIAILRRKKWGELNSPLGLGMPFICSKNTIKPYLENENDNLNPILIKMFNDGIKFYGIKENEAIELLNLNTYEEYQKYLKYLKTNKSACNK